MVPPLRENSALLLDIDGTLLDIARTPDAVIVPPELARALAGLESRLKGAFAFVSGRSLANIDALFGAFRPAAIGAHGAEIRSADGLVTRMPALSSRVRDVFQGLCDHIPGLVLEDKSVALALHYRLAPESRPVLLAAMDKHRKLFEAEKVCLIHGKLVIEAKPEAADKGRAVTVLARQKPFAGRSILFGGDDTTDTDVFRILPQLGGRGFSVGRRFAGAQHLFESPRAVRNWLIRLDREGLAG